METPNAPDGRWAAIYSTMTGATAPGHHVEAATGTNAESIKAGHEPDRFDARGIVLVPILVVIVTACAYILVTGLFNFVNPGKPSPGVNPAAIADSSQPFNERVERISSIDPKAEFKQPRLEYVRSIDNKRVGEAKPDPAYLRSFQSSETNNTYEITPQDLYPGKFVDPMTGKRLLDDYEWVAKDKGVARIPIAEAMHLLAGKLPHKKDGAAPAGTLGKPTQANGGQAITPAPKAAPAKDDHKH